MTQHIKGHLELATLRILSDGERHGYGIVRLLDISGNDLLRAGEGTIYPLLKKLERNGHVKSRWIGGKKMYRLSHQGKIAYDLNLDQWKSFSSAMELFLSKPLKEVNT